MAGAGHSPTGHLTSPGFVFLPLFRVAISVVPLRSVEQEITVHSPSPPGFAALSTIILRI